jgi:hypothetical protein
MSVKSVPFVCLLLLKCLPLGSYNKIKKTGTTKLTQGVAKLSTAICFFPSLLLAIPDV